MEQKYLIQIYCRGAIIEYAVRDLQRLEAERAILAKILGEELVREVASLPPSDPGRDFYELNSEQLRTYSKMRTDL